MFLQLMVIGELGGITICAVEPAAVVYIKGSERATILHQNMEENNARESNVRTRIVIPALVPVSMQRYVTPYSVYLDLLSHLTNSRSTFLIFLCSLV